MRYQGKNKTALTSLTQSSMSSQVSDSHPPKLDAMRPDEAGSSARSTLQLPSATHSMCHRPLLIGSSNARSLPKPNVNLICLRILNLFVSSHVSFPISILAGLESGLAASPS